MECINDPSMPRTATGIRTIILLLVSICLSTMIFLAMLITALVPTSAGIPSQMHSAPCHIAAVWPESDVSTATCPLAKCCGHLLRQQHAVAGLLAAPVRDPHIQTPDAEHPLIPVHTGLQVGDGQRKDGGHRRILGRVFHSPWPPVPHHPTKLCLGIP